MWLRNDILGVFFNERRGGMPTRDSFGFLRAASIEIARTSKYPFFQSLNDKHPRIKKHGDKVVASGVMGKGKVVVPHTYEMTATLNGNRLNLAYKLNVARTEKVLRSKIWLFANRTLHKCIMSGRVLDKDLEPQKPNWSLLYLGKQPKEPITFLGPSGRLEILGATDPPVYASVVNLKRYPKLEVVYGWALQGLLQKGTYSGDMTLIYGA